MLWGSFRTRVWPSVDVRISPCKSQKGRLQLQPAIHEKHRQLYSRTRCRHNHVQERCVFMVIILIGIIVFHGGNERSLKMRA